MWTTKSVEANDPDVFSSLMRLADHRLLVTERGPFAAHGVLIDIGGLQAQRCSERLSRIMHVEAPRPGVIFLTKPGAEMYLNGASIRYGDIAFVNAGEAYLWRLSGMTNWATMTLNETDMEAVCAPCLDRHPTRTRGFAVFTPPVEALAHLRMLHTTSGNMATASAGSVRQTAFARTLEQALIMAMVEGIGAAGARSDTMGRQHHQRIIRRFFEVLEAQASPPSYFHMIHDVIGVSARSLRAACQQQLGVSPKQYVLLRRMRLARHALQQADPAITRVTDIATEFGFWELGRFAVRYRQIFGEMPSATLKAV